jgi:NADH:ubiquinone oxidoreductase subunit C
LHKSRFGRSDQVIIWVDLRKIREVAELICTDSEIGLDWLENFSVAQVDDALVATYFIRSFQNPHFSVILRGSVVLEHRSDSEKCVDMPSVADIWLAATPSEHEYHELFGIRFVGNPKDRDGARGKDAHPILPGNWRGFPLRKDYIFPVEIFGIEHSRKDKNG